MWNAKKTERFTQLHDEKVKKPPLDELRKFDDRLSHLTIRGSLQKKVIIYGCF